MGRSRKGAWIEMRRCLWQENTICVAPVRERGLKCMGKHQKPKMGKVAPVRERGLKLALRLCIMQQVVVAPVRERGLKSPSDLVTSASGWVAPVRERGLKYLNYNWLREPTHGRSRKGAWIEMHLLLAAQTLGKGRSRKGAWIEIERALCKCLLHSGRSRKGAWIEITGLRVKVSPGIRSLP